jgi:hypothetical protein
MVFTKLYDNVTFKKIGTLYSISKMLDIYYNEYLLAINKVHILKFLLPSQEMIKLIFKTID